MVLDLNNLTSCEHKRINIRTMCLTCFCSPIKGCETIMLRELDIHKVFSILKFLKHVMTTTCNLHKDLSKRIKHPISNINVGCSNNLPYGSFSCLMQTSLINFNITDSFLKRNFFHNWTNKAAKPGRNYQNRKESKKEEK